MPTAVYTMTSIYNVKTVYTVNIEYMYMIYIYLILYYRYNSIAVYRIKIRYTVKFRYDLRRMQYDNFTKIGHKCSIPKLSVRYMCYLFSHIFNIVYKYELILSHSSLCIHDRKSSVCRRGSVIGSGWQSCKNGQG